MNSDTQPAADSAQTRKAITIDLPSLCPPGTHDYIEYTPGWAWCLVCKSLRQVRKGEAA